MWIFDLFCCLDSFDNVRYYKYSPGRWWMERLLNVLTILCFVLARVFRHRVALMIILLVLGIGLLVYSIIYSFRTIEIYHEFQDWEQRRRKKDTNGEKTG